MRQFFQRLLGIEDTPEIAAPDPQPAPPATPPKETLTVGPTIAIVNVSTVLSDAQISTATAALQIQIDRDFGPAWQIGADLISVATGAPVPSGTWVIYVMDTTDQAGELGYHDITSEGNPLGKIFAKDDMTYGLSWTVTLSHELMEMLADPYIQNSVFVQDTNTTGRLYALEVADSCQEDSFGYSINGVLVSDFVFPAWFEGFRSQDSTRFDYMGVLRAPLTLAKGGYIGVFEVNPQTTGWSQKLAEMTPGRRVTYKGAYSRFNRRKSMPKKMT